MTWHVLELREPLPWGWGVRVWGQCQQRRGLGEATAGKDGLESDEEVGLTDAGCRLDVGSSEGGRRE